MDEVQEGEVRHRAGLMLPVMHSREREKGRIRDEDWVEVAAVFRLGRVVTSERASAMQQVMNSPCAGVQRCGPQQLHPATRLVLPNLPGTQRACTLALQLCQRPRAACSLPPDPSPPHIGPRKVSGGDWGSPFVWVRRQLRQGQRWGQQSSPKFRPLGPAVEKGCVAAGRNRPAP